MNFFFLDNFLKIENTNLKFYNIADILIYNITISSLLSVDIIDNVLQITTKNNDVYKLEFMDNNQLLSAKQIILNIINGSTDYIGVNGKYRDLSTYYTLSGFIDTAYSGNNILRLKDKSNISKYLILMNTIRNTTVQNHILVISMYDKSVPLRFLTHGDAKNAKNTLDTYISNNMGPGGGSGGSGVVTNHSQLVLNDGTNPHGTTKSDVGLGNVDNTSDINKPISNATLTALNNKVDKITGKGLSQEDFTTTYKDKLDGIESGAEVNVQADWVQSDNTADDYIKNKPTIPTVLNNHSQLTLDDGTNPHGTTKSDVGLGNVPNLDTTDAVNNSHSHSNKSILDLITEPFTTSLKSLYDGAVTNINNLLLTGQRLITSSEITKLNNTSGTNTGDETTFSIQTKRPLKTIEGQSLEGIGNIDLTKNDVGLSNVDNTSDINKPISTATQNALNSKENVSNKAVDFSVVNDTLYPSVKAVDDFVKSQRLEVPFSNTTSVTINHNLDKICSVTVSLDDGSFALCDYYNIDNNNILVEFSVQQTGKIILI